MGLFRAVCDISHFVGIDSGTGFNSIGEYKIQDGKGKLCLEKRKKRM